MGREIGVPAVGHNLYSNRAHSAATSHSCWDPVPAPTFEERFGLRLRPTAPEQPLGPLCAKQESSRRIFSTTTLDLDHGCLQLRDQMGAGVMEHCQKKITRAGTQSNARLS